jgi:hypothetical protein
MLLVEDALGNPTQVCCVGVPQRFGYQASG